MKIIDHAKKIAIKAGALTVKKSQKVLKISEKAKHDLVTNADKASEKLIIKEIKAAYPSHAILAEESYKEKDLQKLLKAKYIWIIDPIDGTTNYTHGLPQYCVSIGIFKTESKESSKNYDYLEGEIVGGVVYAPMLDELFHAEKGKGAYLNGKKIKASNIKKLNNSLLVTGFPPAHKEINMAYFNEMINHCQAVRRFGSAALDLCYIAAGRFDAYWEFGLKPWDIAAGALIVEEAGGKVSDTNGNMLDLFGMDILASNKKVHKETIKIFNKI